MPSVFWMRACPQSDRPTQRLSSSSVVVYTGWMTETLEAGEAGAKHLDPNWWKCRDSSICQSHLHYTLLVTFLGALNIMTDHPVSSRWLHRGERFIIARCFSSTWRGREQRVEVISESLHVITEEDVDRYDASDGAHCSVSIFSAIRLCENQVVLEGFWYNVSQVWKWQRCDWTWWNIKKQIQQLNALKHDACCHFFFLLQSSLMLNARISKVLIRGYNSLQGATLCWMHTFCASVWYFTALSSSTSDNQRM